MFMSLCCGQGEARVDTLKLAFCIPQPEFPKRKQPFEDREMSHHIRYCSGQAKQMIIKDYFIELVDRCFCLDSGIFPS